MSANVTTLPASDVGIATDFVLKLVQLGFIGLAGLLFVLVFLILWKNQPADEGMAKFRMAFLAVGFLSVLVSAGVQILPTKATTAVTFSTDFTVAALPTPAVRLLPGGKQVQPEEEFSLPTGSTISIRTDQMLAEARQLKVESQQLQATSQVLAKAASQLAEAEPARPAEAQEVQDLSTQVSQNLREGKFNAARIAANRLNTVSETIGR
jgi:preprotein translocase subunit SecF